MPCIIIQHNRTNSPPNFSGKLLQRGGDTLLEPRQYDFGFILMHVCLFHLFQTLTYFSKLYWIFLCALYNQLKSICFKFVEIICVHLTANSNFIHQFVTCTSVIMWWWDNNKSMNDYGQFWIQDGCLGRHTPLELWARVIVSSSKIKVHTAVSRYLLSFHRIRPTSSLHLTSVNTWSPWPSSQMNRRWRWRPQRWRLWPSSSTQRRPRCVQCAKYESIAGAMVNNPVTLN